MKIPSANDDAWNTAQGQLHGKPSLLRFRPNLRNFLGSPRYPRRLTVTWEFGSSNTSGMPSPEQSDDMRLFEDAVVDALDVDRLAVLAFVFTNDGIREWNFYLDDVEEVGARINQALSDFPRLPLHLQVEDDPAWSELENVLEMCR